MRQNDHGEVCRGPALPPRGVRELWLTTSNDNLDALRFYQRRGF
jgi:ribosomal protein S18 acetylase RimI-like enzyme